MKKIGILFLLLTFTFLAHAQTKVYVVTMKSSFESPVLDNRTDNVDRIRQSEQNERKRNDKKVRLDSFIQNKGLSNVRSHFMDVKVGFVAPLSDTQRSDLLNEVENFLGPSFTLILTSYLVSSFPNELVTVTC